MCTSEKGCSLNVGEIARENSLAGRAAILTDEHVAKLYLMPDAIRISVANLKPADQGGWNPANRSFSSRSSNSGHR
jgi:hypothetical protein